MMIKHFFYTINTTEEQRFIYEEMLRIIGALSNLFSESDSPYLASRITENLFCRALAADNLARGDITADAMKNNVGVGIKTWVNSDNQKIAEFDKARPQYIHLPVEKQVEKIAELRNERINFTMRNHSLKKMFYHCLVREPNRIIIKECPLVPIDISHIRSLKPTKGGFEFGDGISTYKFNYSKSTLFKYFDDLEEVAVVDVDILSDPFSVLFFVSNAYGNTIRRMGKTDLLHDYVSTYNKIKKHYCLPLYSWKKGVKFVFPQSNINIRFAGGRSRDLYEAGIPIFADFSKKCPDFFHPYSNLKSDKYDVYLPNGKKIKMKRCQDDGKSLMSDPNSDFGHWLIDDVLQISPEEVITYEMLEKYGIDSVYIDEYEAEDGTPYYKMDFARCGAYEKFMQEIDSENEDNG